MTSRAPFRGCEVPPRREASIASIYLYLELAREYITVHGLAGITPHVTTCRKGLTCRIFVQSFYSGRLGSYLKEYTRFIPFFVDRTDGTVSALFTFL